jgi:hypothetical protein
MPSRLPALAALTTAGGLLIGGCSSAPTQTSAPRGHIGGSSAPTTLTVVVHPVQVEFVTASGASSAIPTGPLAAGDRVVGTDEVLESGAVGGHDFEVCTVTFGLHVLCDDMLSLGTRGDLHATWAFEWPSTGTAGPSSFDGVIDGGTSAFHNAAGVFHAVALPPGRDVGITATFTQ